MTATIVDFHEFRRLRALAAPDTTFSPTGDASPPCADDGTLPAGHAPAGLSIEDPGGSPDKRVAMSDLRRVPTRSGQLRVGDKVLDYDTRTIGVATFIEYGPHGAPAQVRVMLKHGSAWRRADRIERLFR